MPSQPDPKPVLFDPLEGRRQGSISVEQLSELQGGVPSQSIGGASYTLWCQPTAKRPSRHSSARRPRPRVEGLAHHHATIEAIKGSPAVCQDCLRSMRRYALDQDWPPEQARGIHSVGATRERQDKLAQLALKSAYADILHTRPSIATDDSPEPGLRFKRAAAHHWACPYCAIDDRGHWNAYAPHRYFQGSSNSEERHQMLYATPYLTTHLLAMTQAVIPPPVSHLRISTARSELAAASSSRFNKWAPYRTSDKPINTHGDRTF